MNVIVSGASGWLGNAISQELDRSDVDSFAIVRNTPTQSTKTPTFTCDFSKDQACDELVEQYEAHGVKAHCFIHCAALAHRPDETKELKQRFHDVNINGTRQVVRFCQKATIQRIIYVGTIAGYDWNSNCHKAADEDSYSNPTTEYAKSKLEGERIVAESGLDWRVVRLATVFGLDDPANFLKLSQMIRANRFIVPGSGSARKSVIPIDLAAQLICQFAMMDLPRHRLINLALPETPSLKEICDGFSEVCDFPNSRSLPLPLMQLLAKIGDAINALRPIPLTTPTLAKLTSSTRVDIARMKENFPQVQFSSFIDSLRRHSDYYKNS